MDSTSPLIGQDTYTPIKQPATRSNVQTTNTTNIQHHKQAFGICARFIAKASLHSADRISKNDPPHPPPSPAFPDVTSKLKPHQRCTTIIAASRLICDDAIRSQQTMPYELLIDSPKSAVSSPRSVLWRTQTKKVVAAYEFGEGRPAFLFCARGQNELYVVCW